MTKLAGFEYTNYIADNLCSKGIPLFKGKNVQNGKIVYEFEAYIPESVSDSLERSQVTKKCLLTPYVGTIGNIGIHSRVGKYHLGSNVGKIEILNPTDATRILLEEYVHYYLLSQYGYAELTKFKKATAQESISIDAIREVFIPIPPSQEQIKIVEKIEQIIPLADRYAESQRKLDTLNSSINLELKKSILQEAIQGKLVPQDPNDEPASALLERIREEKQRLLKEGKLRKKDITDSIIFKGEDNKYYERLGKSIIEIDEHIPYNIPESWEWTTLDFVSYSVGSRANQVQSKEILKEGYYPVVSQGLSLVDGYVNDDSKIIKDLPVILFGDHTRNVKYIDFPFVIGADGTKLHKAIGVYPQYLFLWMLYAANTLRDRGYARHYSLLRKTYIPLPPYKEQIRIVKKYDTALASIMRG